MRHTLLLALALAFSAAPALAKGHGGHGGGHGGSGAVSGGSSSHSHASGAVRAVNNSNAARAAAAGRSSTGCLMRDERGNCTNRDTGGATRAYAPPRFEQGGAPFSGP